MAQLRVRLERLVVPDPRFLMGPRAGLWTNGPRSANNCNRVPHSHPSLHLLSNTQGAFVSAHDIPDQRQMWGHSRKEIQVLVSRRTQTKRPPVVGPGLSCELCDPEQMTHVFWTSTSSVGTVTGLPHGVD